MGLIVVIVALLLQVGGATAAEVHTLRNSLYYSAMQQDYAAGDSAAFRNVRGTAIGWGSPEFLAAAAVEGTAVFTDGTVLNFDRLVDGEVRWKRSRSRYGLDARGCGLVPFRSAAVDPSVVALGTRLFIARTRGLPLPGGRTHDGVWIATDTGQGIVGDRIDLFTGRGIDSMRTVEEFGIRYLDPLRAEIVGRDSPCPKSPLELSFLLTH